MNRIMSIAAGVFIIAVLCVFVVNCGPQDASNINLRFGINATTTEINRIADGITATAAEVNNTIDGTTTTAAELNTLAGVTAGTVTASKALVVGSSKELDTLTITSLTTSSIQSEAKDAVIASDDTLYAAGSYRTSGTSFLARPIAAKYELLLETGAVAGDWFEVYVADSDSLRIRAATGDSLIAENGSASNVLGTVAGSARFTMLVNDKWFIQNAKGTWTASLN